MASAAATIGLKPYTLEADTTEATATKGIDNLNGVIVNGGSVKVFLSIGGTIATTDAQAEGVIGLPAGCSISIPRWIQSFSYKTAASTSVLYWFPDAN